MDFRRIPFQFSTTDPSKRQEELQRRFGLPANKGNMYVDFATPGAMGARSDNSSASNSPRLQHRVPIFVEGQSEPTKPSVDAQNVDSGRKPRVRVIPIEIEGQDPGNKKQRWFSGSSEPVAERFNGTSIPVETVKHPVQDPSPHSAKAPRVCNIPIKIEGSANLTRPKSPVKPQKVKSPEPPKNIGVKLNGLGSSKVKVNEKKESPAANEKKQFTKEEITLQKIENILEKLKGYHSDVEKFSGTNKEKMYRYLDEMLTRCMLELDEIDTLGLDTIRLARKAAVKKVQASIDLLEAKITKEDSKPDQVSKEPMQVESSADQSSEDVDMKVELEASEEIVPIETSTGNDNSTELKSVCPEATVLPEKVGSISVMETEEAVVKPDEKEPVNNMTSETNATSDEMNVEAQEQVCITEVEADNCVTSEVEPIVEEPVSNLKDENSEGMDLGGPTCESDLKLDEPSVQICEIKNDAVLDSNKLGGDLNLEMEVNETFDIPAEIKQTVLSNNISEVKVITDDSSAAEPFAISNDS